mmetsp:Transcript_14114/g.42687  ORF Transcript_14114/g.42687 Transcript_14114/m.42687 type:complete len:234 (-) Transcript_14114:114-815(-)
MHRPGISRGARRRCQRRQRAIGRRVAKTTQSGERAAEASGNGRVPSGGRHRRLCLRLVRRRRRLHEFDVFRRFPHGGHRVGSLSLKEGNDCRYLHQAFAVPGLRHFEYRTLPNELGRRHRHHPSQANRRRRSGLLRSGQRALARERRPRRQPTPPPRRRRRPRDCREWFFARGGVHYHGALIFVRSCFQHHHDHAPLPRGFSCFPFFLPPPPLLLFVGRQCVVGRISFFIFVV